MRMRCTPLAVLLASCTTGQPDITGCRDDGDCSGLSVCRSDGACEEVECLTSAQCSLDAYCSDNTCVPGCETQDDCLSGMACDDGQCLPTDCDDSQIDCRFGERCNIDVGLCEPDLDLCMSCSGEGGAVCREEVGGRCWFFDGGQYCLPPCSPHTEQAKLPRGFDCLDFDDSDAEQYYLFGDCSDVDAVRNPEEPE